MIEQKITEVPVVPKKSGKQERELSELERFRQVIEGRKLPNAPEQIAGMIVDLAAFKQQEKEAKAGADRLSVELKAEAIAQEIPGWETPTHTCIVSVQTRTTLSRERLLELGVTQAQLDEAMVESEPFYVLNVRERKGK